jgi:response regulator RpfG family c-di-GMP phosphodiesterase
MDLKKGISIAERLLKSNRISKEKYDEALSLYKDTQDRIEDILIEIEALNERELLQALANYFRTQYVSSEKLSKLSINRRLLEIVPLRFAEQYGIAPLFYDEKKRLLSIITADPDEANAIAESRVLIGVDKIKAYIARPAAIKAAISKWYKGEPQAFSYVDLETKEEFQALLHTYERQLLDEESMESMSAALIQPQVSKERLISKEELEQESPLLDQTTLDFSKEAYIETLNVLIGLIETQRSHLKGHSALVAQHSRNIAQRIGLSDRELKMITIASYLHDLGKGVLLHLTPLNVSKCKKHKEAAEKYYQTPIKLFESVPLPNSVKEAILNLYEQYNGEGFPKGKKGQEIPLFARIIGIVDTYTDLITNPSSLEGRVLSVKEAHKILEKYKDTVFDGNIIDLFRLMSTGDDLKQRLLGERRTILLVDSDLEHTTVLELRFLAQGFDVKVARNMEQALRILRKTAVDLIISEVNLSPEDGFDFLSTLQRDKKLASIPFIFLSTKSKAEDVNRGFNLGAVDYLAKPFTTEVLVAKVKQIMEQKLILKESRGVTGSLKEMGLADLIQIMATGRRTGQLKLKYENQQGEIHLQEGHVVNALFEGMRGEEAFYAMLKYKEGTFIFDPKFKPPSKVITQDTESLLLEGMRRIDEKIS